MNDINIQVYANRKLSKKTVDIGNMQESGVTKLIFELDEDIVALGGNVYLFVSYDGSTYPYPLTDNSFEIGRELTQRKKASANVVISTSEDSENLLDDIVWISNTLTLMADKNDINVDSINETELPPSLQIVYDRLLNLEKDLQEKKDSDYWRGPQGPQGEQGIQGPQGEQGEKGDTGEVSLAYAKQNFSNAIITAHSGETILTTDSAAVPPVSLTTFGKSTQRQYEGNQLFEKITMASLGETISEDGLTATCTPQTAEGYSNQFSIFHDGLSLTAGVTYYISAKIKLDSGALARINTIQWMDANNVHIAKTGTPILPQNMSSDYQFYKFAFQPTEDIVATKIYVQGYQAESAVCTITDIMVTTNPDADWEPFVGGQASPSIVYPQEVTPLGASGSIVGKVLTGNLFKPNVYLVNCTYDGDGIYSIASGKNVFCVNSLPDSTPAQEIRIPNGDITLSFEIKTTNSFTVGSAYLCTIGSFVKNYGFNVNQTVTNGTLKVTKTLTLVNDVEKIGLVIYGNTVEGLKIKNISLKRGSDDTYEPYTEQSLTFQTPNGLHGIPLGQTIPSAIANSPIHMSGVYWDKEEGRYYIGDTKNENGKDVQRVNTVDLSTLTWERNEAWWQTTIDDLVYVSANTEIGLAMCTTYHIRKATGFSTASGSEFAIDTSNIKFARNGSEDTPIGELTYVLAEPIITDTSAEELAQFNALRMNYPNTTIVNDAGAYTELEYVADTHEHIKQNYAPKSEIQEMKEQIAELQALMVNNS